MSLVCKVAQRSGWFRAGLAARGCSTNAACAARVLPKAAAHTSTSSRLHSLHQYFHSLTFTAPVFPLACIHCMACPQEHRGRHHSAVWRRPVGRLQGKAWGRDLSGCLTSGAVFLAQACDSERLLPYTRWILSRLAPLSMRVRLVDKSNCHTLCPCPESNAYKPLPPAPFHCKCDRARCWAC